MIDNLIIDFSENTSITDFNFISTFISFYLTVKILDLRIEKVNLNEDLEFDFKKCLELNLDFSGSKI